jgi:uncharacterized protein (UPF0371 family)
MASFDNERYLKAQTEAIKNRIDTFKGKLYLEFGGKMILDMHASRVLPGYDPNVKIKLLQRLKDILEIVYCIHADDIEKGRMRGDFGLTYDEATLKTFDDLEDFGFKISGVVVNRYRGEKSADKFINFLENRGIRIYKQPTIDGYPADVEKIVSPEGYGKNPFVETTKPLVVVTGAGPGSGKMSTCLSQVYHHHVRDECAGYAKFETFPIWNLPLKHPVNIAYEAATADLQDVNMVDPFHLSEYNATAINYNRDVENFPILTKIIAKISDDNSAMSSYKSPTDMGVNMAKEGIVDDEGVANAARQEMIRRYFRYAMEFKQGKEVKATVDIAEKLMEEVGVKATDRPTVPVAREAAEKAKELGKGNRGIFCGSALQLKDGQIVAGMNSPLMRSESAVILNAVKILAGIPKDIDLLPELLIQKIGTLKKNVMGRKSESLNVQETLIALTISATNSPASEVCLHKLEELAGCEFHSTHLLSKGGEEGLRRLNLNVTTDNLPTSRGFYY